MAEGQLLLRTILLGVGAAAVYDMLRPFRLRFRRWTPWLDGGYVLAVGVTAFAFLLRQSSGELRGFLLAGGAGGAALYAALFSQMLQPVWQFWAETAVELVRLTLLPAALAIRCVKKITRAAKNLFYFMEKCYTIRKIGYQAQFE